MPNNNCPICGLPGSTKRDRFDDENNECTLQKVIGNEIHCEDCGNVYFHSPLYRQIKIERENPEGYPDTLFKMACLLYERKLQGKLDPIAFYMKDHGRPQGSPYPCYEYEEWVKSFPVDPLAKIDKALLNFKNFIGEDTTKTIEICQRDPQRTSFTEHVLSPEELRAIRAMFCREHRSAYELATLMQDLAYIELYNSSLQPSPCMFEPSEGFSLRITAHGWHRISELYDQQAKNSETCFVAMQFHPNTDCYREAVAQAAKDSGYKAIFIDEKEHNDFIMDEVINSINEARFVIADFTTMPEEIDDKKVKNGVRGGVYWEAGYARGLRKEVIHTCKDDDEAEKRLHFDVQQINTIFWNDDKDDLETLTKRLFNRIKVVVGKGPLLDAG